MEIYRINGAGPHFEGEELSQKESEGVGERRRVSQEKGWGGTQQGDSLKMSKKTGS